MLSSIKTFFDSFSLSSFIAFPLLNPRSWESQVSVTIPFKLHHCENGPFTGVPQAHHTIRVQVDESIQLHAHSFWEDGIGIFEQKMLWKSSMGDKEDS